MNERTMRLRLGIFVIASLLLLAGLIVMFGSFPGLFKRSTAYTVRFTDAPGISPGTPVRRAGVRIGTVRDVVLDDERGIVRVQLAIDPPHTLRNSEQATLVIGILGSDASIDFIPRPAEEGEPVDRGLVDPGAELVGVKAANVNTLLRRASEVVPNTQETLNDIRKSMQRLERLAGRLEKMTPLAEDTLREYRELARSARQTIPDLRKTNTEYQSLAKEVRDAIPDIRRTNIEIQELAKSVREAVPDARVTLREVNDLARSVRQTLPAFEKSADELRLLAQGVRESIPAFRATMDDFGATARTYGRLGERIDVLVQTNQEKAVKTLEGHQEAVNRFNRLLGDENQRNVQSMLANSRSASENFPSISRSADDVLNQGRASVRQLNKTLEKLEALSTDLQKMSKPAGDRADSITRNLDEAAIKLNATLTDVRALMRNLDRSDGTLKKFLTEPSLYNNLDAAACMAAKLVPRLDRMLKDFEIFADKLARHPEALGIGGMVRPGSGLKNPPTPPIAPGNSTVFPAFKPKSNDK
jgi:phospholipid/cholesterol/gamma-HCH transport system substrate-binding protein